MSDAAGARRADAWWGAVRGVFERPLAEFVRRAQEAERAETGHDCGHEWTITVRSRGHSCGIAGDPDSPHSDDNWSADVGSVTVRAHSLRMGLIVAAVLPVSAFAEDGSGFPE